uniref:Uncharacterized protein n=1 Tax=Glossina palpalis gambiensis TaxID=67801 RepID=A0A1B0C4R7_9MUSC
MHAHVYIPPSRKRTKSNRTLQHLRIYNKSGLHYHTTITNTTTTTTTTTATATFGNINISHFKNFIDVKCLEYILPVIMITRTIGLTA